MYMLYIILYAAKLEGLEPDLVDYSAAVTTWSRVRVWQRAPELLEEARRRGLEPNVIMYNAEASVAKLNPKDKYQKNKLRK